MLIDEITDVPPRIVSLIWIICPTNSSREIIIPPWVDYWRQKNRQNPETVVGTLYDFKEKMESHGYDKYDLSKTFIDFNFVSAIPDVRFSGKGLISELLMYGLPKNFVSFNPYNPSYIISGKNGLAVDLDTERATLMDRQKMLLNTYLNGRIILDQLAKRVGYFPSMILDSIPTSFQKTDKERDDDIRSRLIKIKEDYGVDSGLRVAQIIMEELLNK